MSNNVRVRFAPSPTGHLHIGGARTALFNWLFARHCNGKFILRIEDTDTNRSTDEYIQTIIEGMKWLGLDWDEGPFRQTARFDIYRNYIDKLIQEGWAYRCYCTTDELEQRRQEAMAQGKSPRYNGKCRHLQSPQSDKPAAIRFKMPEFGTITINDLIKGEIIFENSILEDMIIMRSDGTPTYNFCAVVDDIDMKITHIIRGDDHINNTPKQLHIYKAFGWDEPEFAHIPMILGADKSRLSKRHGAASVLTYRDMGYLPQALINYLVRMGWSFGDKEIFTKDELIRYFSLENVGSAPAVFNPERLLWLNAHYINFGDIADITTNIIPYLISQGVVKEDYKFDLEWLKKAVYSLRERAKTLIELVISLKYYILDDIEIEIKARDKFLKPEDIWLLAELKNNLDQLNDFTAIRIEKIFIGLTEKYNIKLAALAQPVRVAITGGTRSPGIFEVMEIMGKDKVLRRLQKIIEGA